MARLPGELTGNADSVAELAVLYLLAPEPADPDSRLLRHPSVLSTPHLAGLTERMFRRSGDLVAANLQRWKSGQPPEWAANMPRHQRHRASGGGHQ